MIQGISISFYQAVNSRTSNQLQGVTLYQANANGISGEDKASRMFRQCLGAKHGEGCTRCREVVLRKSQVIG